MPRPSLKAERTEEVLEAYERCVARYGVEGTTLERTAEEAGLTRTLIRHYVGNKDALLNALVERFSERSMHDNAVLFGSLPQGDRVSTLINWLFDPSLSNAHSIRVAGALIMAARDYPKLARRMRSWTLEFVALVADELQSEYPNQSQRRIDAIAAGITGVYFNIDSLESLGQMSQLRTASKEAVQTLVDSLKD